MPRDLGRALCVRLFFKDRYVRRAVGIASHYSVVGGSRHFRPRGPFTVGLARFHIPFTEFELSNVPRRRWQSPKPPSRKALDETVYTAIFYFRHRRCFASKKYPTFEIQPRDHAACGTASFSVAEGYSSVVCSTIGEGSRGCGMLCDLCIRYCSCSIAERSSFSRVQCRL